MTTQDAAVGLRALAPPASRRFVAWRLLVKRAFVVPAIAFLSASVYFGIRSTLQVVPEGDATLHLHMMETVAKGHLPKTVPFFAAILSEGGQVEAFFPYSYTPLYHLVGGLVFKLGGEGAVLMMGPFWAGVIAVGIVFLLRPYPLPAVALALVLIFSHWLTQPVMTWVFMEPMMLAFFIGGLVFYQRAWSQRSLREAVLAGICFGLAVATRQAALLYLAFVAAHGAATLVWHALRGFQRDELRAALRRYGAMAVATALVSLPFLGYLVWTTGTVGYGQFFVPGLTPNLPVEAEANGYLSAISTPDAPSLEWLDSFWSVTLYTTRWQPRHVVFLPLILFGIGIAYLATRSDRASQFLASYIPVHILGEMLQYVTIHGNWRYIIASRVLFSAVVAIGIWWLLMWTFRTVRERSHWQPSIAGVGATGLVVLALVPSFVTPGLVDYLVHQEESRAEKGQSFRELGEYVDEHVPEDALLLSGRWYTTGWYLRRNYTWVTYFGNAWVIDAISNRSPPVVRDLLTRYGIDYIVFQAPPPKYMDRMPSGGLRTIVLDDLEHFQLLFRNERTRLYRFWPEGIQR